MDRLSTLQFNLLKVFATAKPDYHMTLEQAATFDQRPFRSLWLKEWIGYRAGRGFHINQAGRDAWNDYQTHSILRRNPYGPLTSAFDASAYRTPHRTKLRIVA